MFFFYYESALQKCMSAIEMRSRMKLNEMIDIVDIEGIHLKKVYHGD